MAHRKSGGEQALPGCWVDRAGRDRAARRVVAGQTGT